MYEQTVTASGIDNINVSLRHSLTYFPEWNLGRIRIIAFFFISSGTHLRARTFARNVGWGGHTSTVGVTLPEVWARSVQCVAGGKPFKLF